MTLSLGLINLLEWLTELRETFYSLDYQFIMKGYNTRTADGRQAQGKNGERGRCFHALSMCTILPVPSSVHQLGNSPNPALLGFCGGLIT